MNAPPWRHGIFLLVSASALTCGYLLLSFGDQVGLFSLFFFLLALFLTIVAGLVIQQQWIAFLWPALFLLLGLVSRHTALLGMDLLFGFGFTALFFLIRQNAANLLKVRFFPIVQPALKTFLIILFLAGAVGIFAGISSRAIEAKIQEGISEITFSSGSRLPLIGKFLSAGKAGDWIVETMKKSERSLRETDLFAEILTEAIAVRVKNECIDNPSCIRQIEMEMQQESLFTAFTSPDADPKSSEAIKLATGEVLQRRVGEWGAKVNFSLIIATIIFILLIPFAGIFSWVLSFLFALGFGLMKWSNLVRKEERPVVQEFFS